MLSYRQEEHNHALKRVKNMEKVKRKRISKDSIILLLMTLPSALILFIFAYLPITGWIYSFYDYRIGYDLSMCEFIWFDNFKYAFGDPYVLRVLWNTLSISLLGLLNIPIACAIAILLSEVRFLRFRKTVQTTITLPYFISWVIVYAIAYALFSTEGLINLSLNNAFGWELSGSPLSNPDTAKLFMVSLNIWKNAGYNSIIFFASIASIDMELYDAAQVDGCGRWQKIRYITIPSLASTLLIVFIIQIGYILNSSFDQYYCFINPIIQNEIEVLDYYVYRLGMLEQDIPVSTAVSMTKSFVSVILVFLVNRVAKKAAGQSII